MIELVIRCVADAKSCAHLETTFDNPSPVNQNEEAESRLGVGGFLPHHRTAAEHAATKFC